MKQVYTILLFVVMMSALQAQNFALHFDGDNDEVRMTNEAIFLIGAEFTIEAWINATEWRDEQWQGSLVCTDKSGPDEGFAFRCGKQGTLSFVMSVNNTWNEIITGPIMSENVWNHVAIVIKDNTMSLIVNGESEATKSYTGTFSGNQLARLKIGASSEFPGRIFHGAIDEVRIWSIGRTAEELFDNSTIQMTGSEPGLIAYLPLDEGTGFTTANLINDTNPGVLLNMEENDWVGGASLSGVDIGVTDIIDPNLIDLFERPVEVSASIKNFGNEDVSSFDIEVLLNGTIVHSETANLEIASGEKKTYTLSRFIEADDLDFVNIEVRTSKSEDTNNLNDSQSLNYSKPVSSTIRLFDQRTHNFGADGQTHNITTILPADLQDYDKLLLHINLACPTGGCDPWDQPANISVISDGQEYEIARYVTPYGKACGPWVVDVTDFKTILGGLSRFKSYIQVWGGSGWNLTADLELIENSTEPVYQKFTPLWQTDYWVYGDPGINDDLEQRSVIIEDETLSSHVRMTISGHGQGNTQNAAEFSQKTHAFTVDNVAVQDHFLWKSDCATNICNNQSGTWTLSRAGWCPGQAVEPYVVNMTDHLSPGFLVRLDYDLDDYVNLLNTGYNGGSHTEPHYRIHSYLIEESNERYGNFRNLLAEAIEVPLDASMSPTGPIEFTFSNNGTVLVNNPVVQYFVNGVLIQEDIVQATIQPGDTYTHEFTEVDGFSNGENAVVAHIDYNNDQNIGDDYIKTTISGIVSSEDVYLLEGVSIYPNPSTGVFNLEFSRDINIKAVELFTLTGQEVLSLENVEKSRSIKIDHPGIYLIKITDVEGRSATKKLIVTN